MELAGPDPCVAPSAYEMNQEDNDCKCFLAILAARTRWQLARAMQRTATRGDLCHSISAETSHKAAKWQKWPGKAASPFEKKGIQSRKYAVS